MPHMKTLLIAILAFVIFLPACKKYPEGPLVSIMPRKERIEGRWVATSVKYNSTDSLTAYKDYIWEFTRNYSVILQVGSNKYLGIWSTVSGDNEFRIDYDNGNIEQYEIIRLTSKEFWLRHKKSQLDFQLSLK